VTDPEPHEQKQPQLVDPGKYLPPRNEGFKLLRKVIIYHVLLAVFTFSLAMIFPGFVDLMPIGGISELEESGDLRVTQVEEVSRGENAPELRESHFDITIEETHLEEGPLMAFLKADTFPVSKKGKKGEQLIDAKALVKSITLRSPHSLHLVLAHVAGPKLRPVDIVRRLFRLKGEQIEAIKVLKVK